MEASWLLWGLLFGSIGLGYAIYGRKQQHLVAFLCGLGLIGCLTWSLLPGYCSLLVHCCWCCPGF